MSLPEQLVRDFKQSPGKAVLLGLGVVVAGFVWGPRLKGAFGATSIKAVDENGVVDGDVDLLGRGRTASEIREEFKQISAAARELRGLATGVPIDPPLRDPFHGETKAPDPKEESSMTSIEPVAPIAASTEKEDEEDLVREMTLTGVFRFGGRAVAMIDDHRVELGETYKGFTVAEIVARRVRLQGKAGEYELSMPGGFDEEDDS